jgi:hypothetical protein
MVLTIKRLSLTVLFVILTLSIGLVSVNLPLSSYAQNSALSQKGNGDSEQDIEQSQSSEQNGQVVSGDSSILSGNNLMCQNQDNSDIAQLNNFCVTEAMENPLPNLDVATLKITTIQRANCHFHDCPIFDGGVEVRSLYETKTFSPMTRTAGGVAHYEMTIPIGATYTVIGSTGLPLPWIWTFEGANIQNEKNSCNGWPRECSAVMHPDGAAVVINFHYRCNDSSC